MTKKDKLPPECSIKGINRHNDILPNPKTRVVLPEVDGDVRTTYVNANFIPGFDGNPKTYIAAMGPKQNTCVPFWRMLWENNVYAVVMTTNTVEKGREKCYECVPTPLPCGSMHGAAFARPRTRGSRDAHPRAITLLPQGTGRWKRGPGCSTATSSSSAPRF